MAVIRAGSSQFPFHITDVAALLRLNIRRRGPDFLYVDCPLCGDHRGKLYLKTSRDVWHCNYCQESGGMLALYAKVYGISNADAYREICEALQTGDYAPEYQSYQNRQPQEIAQSDRAPRQAIHQTLSMLFSMLSLTPKHRAHLREVRGLTDDQIERFGFKSTPPPYLCKSLTARLLKQGCTLFFSGGGLQMDSTIWNTHGWDFDPSQKRGRTGLRRTDPAGYPHPGGKRARR